MNKEPSTVQKMKEYAIENKVPIIMAETADLLEILTMAKKPEKVLEIGTAIGYSAVLMARNMNSTAKIDTIDIDPDRIEVAWENIRECGFEKQIRIIEGDAAKIIPCLSGKYDMIFMDGAKSQYVELLPYCIKLLKYSGILITDNVLYKGMTKSGEYLKHKQRTAVRQLREYIEQVQNHPELKTVLVDIGDGITISTKITKDLV